MGRPRSNNRLLPDGVNKLARAGYKPMDGNSDLLDGGDCNPQRMWSNLSTYGFVSPRREYVESIEEAQIKLLAVKWKVNETTLLKWKRDQNWPLERARWLAGVWERQQEVLKGDLGEYQASEISTRIGMWQSLRSMLSAVASKGYIEDPSPTGGTTKREYSPKDLKDMAAVMEKIDNGIGDAIGLSKAVLRKAEDKLSDDTVHSVKEVIYRVTELKPNEPLALPETEILPDIEGEIEPGPQEN